MKSIHWLAVFWIGLFLLGCGRGVTYPIYLRYQPSKDFPEFEQKTGSTLNWLRNHGPYQKTRFIFEEASS